MKDETREKKETVDESRRKFIKVMSFAALQTALFLLLGDESFSGCYYQCYTDCYSECYYDS